MIYIFGDSHANALFNNLPLPHINYFHPSITMHRIGRDNTIINFSPSSHQTDKNSEDIFVLVYGEVDCRCHIQRQINSGRVVETVLFELIEKYFNTIKNNIRFYGKIVVVGIIPPSNREFFENKHGEITHEFPFVGTNEERVEYTNIMNDMLQSYCESNDYVFIGNFDEYKTQDGLLKIELSDDNVHIKENRYFLQQFIDWFFALNLSSS
jgi:hypothetical protein